MSVTKKSKQVPCYGFEWDDEEGGWVPSEVEALILKRIFTGLSSRQSLRGIAISLNKAGFQTREAFSWKKEQIKGVLLEHMSWMNGLDIARALRTGKAKKRSWSAEEYTKVVALRENGFSFGELGVFFGMRIPSARTLYQKAKKALEEEEAMTYLNTSKKGEDLV